MTVYLIRHASAGHRNGGSDEDHLRTLDDFGLAQANLIATTLGQSAITELYSSRATRCIQTLEPLGQKLGLSVTTEPTLFEASQPEASLSFLLALGGQSVALCSHGDVVPQLVAMLQRRGAEVGHNRGFAKGSIWTINFAADGTPATASYQAINPTS